MTWIAVHPWILPILASLVGGTMFAAAWIHTSPRKPSRSRTVDTAHLDALRAVPVDEPATEQPAEHEGATEQYADELHQAGQTLPSADLRTGGEQMQADHDELADAIAPAVDAFHANVDAALARFMRNLDGASLLRLLTTTDATGLIPVIEQEEILAEEPVTDEEIIALVAGELVGSA